MKRCPRYLVLPAWIRFFSWVFVVIGAFAGVLALSGALFDFEGRLMLLGIRYAGPLRAWLPATMGMAFLLLGYAGFALLWGRREGREAGLVAGYIGLGICAITVCLALQNGRLYIPFEPLLQIPFIVTLHRLKARWADEPGQPPWPTAPLDRG